MSASRQAMRGTTPLAQSRLEVTITDFLAEYVLRHTFRNEGAEPIEAVYSFPVPLDAAFIGMEATLGGETLVAQVMPASRATRRYDDAIGDGDSAVLLERLEPGMLCVNLGNLKPGESGEVVLCFAAALGVADRVARFSLPLVHRPRYGRYLMEEWAAPHPDFAVEHPLEATIRVRGLLAGRPVQCATQGARFELRDGETILSLSGAMLDGDLVLGFELGDESISRSYRIKDGDHEIAVLSFVPARPGGVPGAGSSLPLDLCVVLDCSGSMSGDAIQQSRDALRALVGQLDERDRIQVLRFGSRVEPMFRRPLRASRRVVDALSGLVDTVQADLGGTSMDKALAAAIDDMGRDTGNKVILLVTDGAVQPPELESARQRALDAGIRIFVVAVGSSAGVDVLSPLADETRAVLERAVPGEPVDVAVMRQVRRARQRGPQSIKVDWGHVDAWALPIGNIYEGDAVIAAALLPDAFEREVRVTLPGLGDGFGFVPIGLSDQPAWRAWFGQQAYCHAPAERRAEISLRYGLITDETSAVLVKVRAEGGKVEGLPLVIPVAHMQPRGMAAASTRARPLASPVACAMPAIGAFAGADYMDVPAFLRRASEEPRGLDKAPVKTLQQEQRQQAERSLLAGLIDALLDHLLDKFSLDALLERIPEGERELVRLYIEEERPKLVTIRGARALLGRLLDRFADIELTDDQVARLAMLEVM